MCFKYQKKHSKYLTGFENLLENWIPINLILKTDFLAPGEAKSPEQKKEMGWLKLRGKLLYLGNKTFFFCEDLK